MKLKDKIIIVTASTRGIGLAITEAFAREGAKVYMAARSTEKAQIIADRLNSEGCNVRCIYNDASIPDSYYGMADSVAKAEGRIDVLVNNFGISDPQRDLDIMNTEADVFLETVTVNLRSVFMATKHVLGYMMEHGGSIINISSVGGAVPDISQIAYGTSKAAINHLTRMIAVQEAANGIRCNAILPGMTATDAVQTKLSEDFKSLFTKHIPLGRMGLPAEIAAAAVYFASDDSAYTTGQLLTVSGGFGMATPIYGDLAGKIGKR
ncbi:MAG: SDR family oxidoreductase [Clostridia bacterium]|nr:SDR family oxidoreductase [Clostridia bacterium]